MLDTLSTAKYGANIIQQNALVKSFEQLFFDVSANVQIVSVLKFWIFVLALRITELQKLQSYRVAGACNRVTV